jgi:hypothetical protein
VSDTEGDADDESVGSEEIGVEKQFACQAENCDFTYRSEWGIKKHYMVSWPFLLWLPRIFLFLLLLNISTRFAIHRIKAVTRE